MTPFAASSDPRPLIHVVTWFYEHQPGIAIYLARLRALESVARVHLVCKSERDFRRLGVPLAEGTLIDVPGESHMDIANYCWKVVQHLKKQPPGNVVLLASHLSMCTLGLGPDWSTAIYWNEMPVHYFWRARYNKLKGIAPGFLRWLTYLGAKKAHVVMPISEFMQQDLIERGREPANTPVVPMGVCGISSHSPGRKNEQNKPLQVLYSGTLTEERGKRELLEGTLLALKHGVHLHLTLAGLTGEAQQEIQSMFEAAGQSAALTTTGVIPHSEVLKKIEQSDVAFAMLQPHEHFQYNPPTKIFEYLACGTPVIFNDIRTLTAYIQDKETGVLASFSAEGVMAALNWCQSNRAKIAVMRENCTKESQKYLWQQVQGPFISAIKIPTHHSKS